MLAGAFWKHCIGLWPVQCCSKSIKTTLYRIFSYAMLFGAFWTTLHRFITCAMLSQDCIGFFLMQCCLEPFRQLYISFWPVQCCPKSIKAKLQMISLYAMLSGASQTTLHRVFTCEIKKTSKRMFSYAVLCGVTWVGYTSKTQKYLTPWLQITVTIILKNF